MLFVARNHRFAKRGRITVTELTKEPLIVRAPVGGSGMTSRLLKDLGQEGVHFKSGARFDAPFPVKAAVKQKMGVGLSFLDSVRTEVENGELKILRGHGLKLEGQTYIVYRKDKPLSSLAQEFLGLLRRAARRNHSSQDHQHAGRLESADGVSPLMAAALLPSLQSCG